MHIVSYSDIWPVNFVSVNLIMKIYIYLLILINVHTTVRDMVTSQ